MKYRNNGTDLTKDLFFVVLEEHLVEGHQEPVPHVLVISRNIRYVCIGLDECPGDFPSSTFSRELINAEAVHLNVDQSMVVVVVVLSQVMCAKSPNLSSYTFLSRSTNRPQIEPQWISCL